MVKDVVNPVKAFTKSLKIELQSAVCISPVILGSQRANAHLPVRTSQRFLKSSPQVNRRTIKSERLLYVLNFVRPLTVL